MESEKNLSAAEQDTKLEVATAHTRQETLRREERNRQIETLVAHKEQIASRLEGLWQELEQVNHDLSQLLPVR
jgi:chromosome segregation ATPase